jgi:carboxymethylenebutenolidase
LAAQVAAYERYASDIAAAGMDAWLFSYYSPSEATEILQAPSNLEREKLYAQFVDGWVDRIHRLGTHASREERCSGKIGLLGFSLGGMVGVAAANRASFAALAVFYASLPAFYRPQITSLPPLLDVHGDADRAVPLSSGSKLIADARSLGGSADLQIFGRQGHAFDLNLSNPASEPARRVAIAFLTRHLAHD